MNRIDFWSKKDELHIEMINAIRELVESQESKCIKFSSDEPGYLYTEPDGPYSVNGDVCDAVKIDNGILYARVKGFDDWYCIGGSDVIRCSLDSIYDAACYALNID